MKSYHQMSKKELLEEQEKVVAQYEALKKRGLTLDMSRGKPSSEQLDLSRKMLDCITSESSCISEEGIDCRNYGVLDGIKEAKEFIASMVDASAENVIVYGNSSLNLMYDTIARAMLLDANMLILDEATSNVDTRTELQIQKAMKTLMEHKTCFIIAHRLSTIKNADLILVVKDGEVIEMGQHNQLLQEKGFYFQLYNSQYQ